MDRERVKSALSRIGIPVVCESVHGIEIARVGTVTNTAPLGPDRWFRHRDGIPLTQRWRVESGGGIAGNSRKWWLRPLPNGESIGPYCSQKELIVALRAWRRWELP